MTFDLPFLAGFPLTVPVALATFLCGFLEGLAIPFPGTWLLALIGGAARLGLGRIVGFSFLTALGYTAGALVPYSLGLAIRRLGAPAFLPRLGLTEERLNQLQVWFSRYGEPAVFWSRPFWIGNLASIPAGVVRMPLWRFVPYTLAGIWPWAFAILWIGDQAGAVLENFSSWAFWATGFAIAVVALVTWYRQVRLRRRQAEEAAD